MLLLICFFSRPLMWLNWNSKLSLLVGSTGNCLILSASWVFRLFGMCPHTHHLRFHQRFGQFIHRIRVSHFVVLSIFRFLLSLTSFSGHSELCLVILQATRTVNSVLGSQMALACQSQLCTSLPKLTWMELAMVGVFTLGKQGNAMNMAFIYFSWKASF